MADTQRSLAEIVALFADNTAGDISAQDIRDFVASIINPHRGLVVSVQAATTIAAINTWYKAAGTTIESAPTGHLMTLVGSNRIRYDGPSMRHMHIAANVSILVGNNNQTIDIGIAKNGTVLPGYASRKVGTGTDVGSVAVHADVAMSDTDYIELWVRNQTSTATITLASAYLFTMGMMH